MTQAIGSSHRFDSNSMSFMNWICEGDGIRMSGEFAVHAKNRYGLQNQNPPRSLVVVPDQPPQILLEGNDEPMLVRPDDLAARYRSRSAMISD